MDIFLTILLLLTGLFLMLIVLLQRGRGGGLAGAFGGAGGQSMLGVKAGDTFTKITVVVAVVWVILAGWSGIQMRKDNKKSRFATEDTPKASQKNGDPQKLETGVPKAESNSQASPKTDETKTDETKADETKADETKAEDTQADDTKAEDTQADDTKADDTKAGDTKAGDTKAGDTKAGDDKPGQ